MRVGMMLNYSGGFTETVSELADFEQAGLQIVFVPEAYSFDAVSQLGFIAARTTTVEIASGILPIYSRTPALTAMTAAGLDFVSGGRFTLGLGTSGPQVIEGWHGVPYDAPVGRTRELIEICRAVWRRERLDHHTKLYDIPLRGRHRPRQAAQADQPPGPERIPVVIAALGPKNVALAAELAEGWQPIFYFPEKAGLTWDAPLAEGRAKRDAAALASWTSSPPPRWPSATTSTHLRDLARPVFALYIGGMGARGKNFYYDLACRFGYEDEAKRIQDAYLSGRKDEAAALVPAELVEKTSLIGPLGYVGRAPGGLPGGRRHHPQRHLAGPHPRAPGEGHRDDPRPSRITANEARRRGPDERGPPGPARPPGRLTACARPRRSRTPRPRRPRRVRVRPPLRDEDHPGRHELEAGERERRELVRVPRLHRQAGLAVDALPGRRRPRLMLGRQVRRGQVGAGRQGVEQGLHHRLRLVVLVQEVQHRDQHQRDRLAEVEHRPHHGEARMSSGDLRSAWM